MHNYTAVKINALGSPCLRTLTNFVNLPEERIYSELKTLPNTDEIETCHYHLWCEDNQRRVFSVVFDEEGLCKRLYPNHWVNAMIHAAADLHRKHLTMLTTNLVIHRSKNHKLQIILLAMLLFLCLQGMSNLI